MSAGQNRGTILHVFDHSFPIGDGYAFRSGEVVRFQRGAGWSTLHVTSAKQGPSGAERETVDGLEFHRTQLDRSAWDALPGVSQWRVVTSLRVRLAALVDEYAPDLIHVHSPCLNGLAALPVARRLGLPLVYELRSLWEDAAVDSGLCREGDVRYRLSRILETYVCRNVDRVLPICEGLRDEIIRRGVAASRVTVVPNSVDLHRFSAQAERDEAEAARLGLTPGKTFGFIGTFFPFEGLKVLLHAMPQIGAAEPQARLLLVGDGPELEPLRALAAKLGLGSTVEFTGRVPHASVARYYDLIDVLVYPRLSQRLTELVTPLKPLEAMAKEKLIVASDIGGHREMVFPGRNGSLFKAGDPASLARACLELLYSPQNWQTLRRGGHDYVSRCRSWDATVQIYGDCYRELLARAAPPRSAAA